VFLSSNTYLNSGKSYDSVTYLKITVFWDVMPCTSSMVKTCQSFKGACCLRISFVSQRHSQTLLQNVALCPLNYTTLHPRRR